VKRKELVKIIHLFFRHKKIPPGDTPDGIIYRDKNQPGIGYENPALFNGFIYNRFSLIYS
jgi:hypothetical protein